MDTGAPRSRNRDERFKSTDGFITADGRRLWNTVIAVAAVAGAVGLGTAGAAIASAAARTRGGRTVRAAAAGAFLGAGLGGAYGGACGWVVGGMASLKAEQIANEASPPG